MMRASSFLSGCSGMWAQRRSSMATAPIPGKSEAVWPSSPMPRVRTSNEAAASHSVLSALIVKIQANEHKESLLIKDREFALYIMKLVSKQVEAALGKIKSWCERKELHDLAACVKRSCKDSTLSDYVRSVKAELKAAMKLAAKMDAMYASDKQLPTLKAVNGLLMKAIDLLVQMLKTSNSYMATLSNKKFVTCMVSKCEEPYAAYLLVMLKETSKHI